MGILDSLKSFFGAKENTEEANEEISLIALINRLLGKIFDTLLYLKHYLDSKDSESGSKRRYAQEERILASIWFQYMPGDLLGFLAEVNKFKNEKERWDEGKKTELNRLTGVAGRTLQQAKKDFDNKKYREAYDGLIKGGNDLKDLRAFIKENE